MNLLSLLQNQLSPQAVGQISNTVGENPDATKSALGTAFPALLGSLLGKANSSPNGLTEVFNMFKQGAGQGGWSDSISNVLGSLGGGAGGTQQAASGGAPQAGNQSLLSSVLGSKLGPVSDFIASHCGIRASSASSLLGMAAPLLMGTIGKHISSQGLGATGLGQLLNSQAGHIKEALPSGLANTLGIGNLLSGAQAAGAPVSDTAASRPAAPARESTLSTPVDRQPATKGSNVLKWAGVAVLLALFGWFLANRSHQSSDMGGTSETTPPAETGHGAGTPDFASLKLAPGGVADNMAKVISSGDWSKTIELKGLNRDSAGALTDSAKSSVQQMGSVLSAAPSVKARITGRGDTEEAGVSQANKIKNALVSAGIGADRISTSGQTGEGLPTINLVH